MSPRTATPPPTDRRMWRRVLALCHPDGHGDHETFLWVTGLQEHVAGDATEPLKLPRYAPDRDDRDRVPYDSDLGYPDEHVTLTLRALSIGRRSEQPYRAILGLLLDCPTEDHGRVAARQCRGASYRQLARIGHSVGLDGAGRARLYELARCVPLSEAHCHHILSKLKKEAA